MNRKYNCSLENGDDPFEKLYEQLGIVHSVSVPMGILYDVQIMNRE